MHVAYDIYNSRSFRIIHRLLDFTRKSLARSVDIVEERSLSKESILHPWRKSACGKIFDATPLLLFLLHLLRLLLCGKLATSHRSSSPAGRASGKALHTGDIIVEQIDADSSAMGASVGFSS